MQNDFFFFFLKCRSDGITSSFLTFFIWQIHSQAFEQKFTGFDACPTIIRGLKA